MSLRDIAVIDNTLNIVFDDLEIEEDVWASFVPFYDRFESQIYSAKIVAQNFTDNYYNSHEILSILYFLQYCGIECKIEFQKFTKEY